MGHRFDVGAFSDQHRRMGMAEVVRAYRAEAGVGSGQVYAGTYNGMVLRLILPQIASRIILSNLPIL
jgi:hypothetical protein